MKDISFHNLQVNLQILLVERIFFLCLKIMKNFIQHVVYSHREGLRWYFKSTEHKGTFVISLYPWDIRLLKYGLYLLIPPLKETHIKGNWN